MSEFKGRRGSHKNQRAKLRNEQRKRENLIKAAEAKKARSKMTPREKLDILDRRLGKGAGAKRERERLMAALEGK